MQTSATDNYPIFPIYIPSKGRGEHMVTSKALTRMGVGHYVVVEPLEVKEYEDSIKKLNLLSTVIPLDMGFKLSYDTCDNFGLSKSTGPGAARNYAMHHSIKNGYSHHWVMDDNIKGFFRLNKNLRVPCESPAFWRAMEDFCLRYKNVSMAGPNYFCFAPRKAKVPPFITNTRIYSCNLIRNDTGFKWRGRYNEDAILSLDMLKAGWCTVQFNAFLQNKMETQKMKGGNTGEFYHKEGDVKKGEKYTKTGTIAKSQMQVRVHPDVSTIVYRFGRVHHKVDYSRFKKQKLIKNNIFEKPKDKNYGMTLKVDLE